MAAHSPQHPASEREKRQRRSGGEKRWEIKSEDKKEMMKRGGNKHQIRRFERIKEQNDSPKVQDRVVLER